MGPRTFFPAASNADSTASVMAFFDHGTQKANHTSEPEESRAAGVAEHAELGLFPPALLFPPASH